MCDYEREEIITQPPQEAKWVDIARPMPLDEAVIRITLFLKQLECSILLLAYYYIIIGLASLDLVGKENCYNIY